MLRGGAEAEVLAAEQGKVAWLRPHLDAMAGPIAAGVPVFFVGDLNTASHQDWTQEAVDALAGSRPRWTPSASVIPWRGRSRWRWRKRGSAIPIARPIPTRWPSRVHVLRDSFPACGPWDTWDRIDYVYAAGPADVLRSRTWANAAPTPTSRQAVAHGPSSGGVDLRRRRRRPRPSRRRSTSGCSSGDACGSRSMIRRRPGARSDSGLAARTPRPTRPRRRGRSWDSDDDGIVGVDTDGLDAGPYTVALLDDGEVVATSGVALLDRRAPAMIRTFQHRYARGEPIGVGLPPGQPLTTRQKFVGQSGRARPMLAPGTSVAQRVERLA